MSLTLATGCADVEEDAALGETTAAARSELYAWATVEAINFDAASGIAPCVHVSQGELQRIGSDGTVRITTTYRSAIDGTPHEESFDVPLSETRVSQQRGEVSIDVGPLALATEADEQTVFVAGELTTNPSTLPNFWLASLQMVEIRPAWGINPCVHVARSAHASTFTNSLTMAVSAQCDTVDGTTLDNTFDVPLASTIVAATEGPILDVSPADPLDMGGDCLAETLVVDTRLTWTPQR